MCPGRLLIATHNSGKLIELAGLLGDVPFDLVSLDDALGSPLATVAPAFAVAVLASEEVFA